MRIATVAVYSEADANALHVELADEAWPLGPAPARESYLAMDKIVKTAKRCGAQAVHPGYGFLAENAEFAERCAQAGLIFIGPSPQAMRLMGSKASAKALMERAGVPILPGYHGDATDAATMARAAERIGFPLLVKASAGGGGRGMRLVERAEQLPSALESAGREASASFGDGRLLLEKYLARPRHIEIQIFADAHGDVVTFLERDCSIQRRHQKILEETPAPGVSGDMRRAMSAAAVEAARAAGYVGAGTVEFLFQDDAFYFLEMNARLQVEHPVTEMVSGLDLVEWQFRVACGERLPARQDELTMRGCAIEARICAEDSARGFLPSVGLIEHLRMPREDAAVRVDAGVRPGDRVTQHYDSLLAKLVVWGADRAAAIERLREALDEFELVGVAANLDFLRALSRHPRFCAGGCDTAFIETAAQEWPAPPPLSADDEIAVLAAAAAARIADLRREQQRVALEAGDPWSPWAIADGWRLHAPASGEFVFGLEGRRIAARASALEGDAFRLEAATRSVHVGAVESGDRMRLRIDGVQREIGLVRRRGGVVVIIAGRNHDLEAIDPLSPASTEAADERSLSAPLPAKVIRVLIEAGASVEKGAPLVVLEAMKMEITLTAPRDGVIASVRCVEGETAPEGVELVTLAEEDPS